MVDQVGKPYEEVQEVIKPQPTPANWLVGVAVLPDPIKGTSLKFVTIDCYTTRGVSRDFIEAGAARYIAQMLNEAADKVDNAGASLDVVRGGRANEVVHELSRAERRHPERFRGA